MKEKIRKGKENNIPIRSIFLASYLHTKGYNYVKIEPDILGKVIFFYPQSPEILEEIKKFYSNSFLQSFINSYRIIKNKLYEEMENIKE